MLLVADDDLSNSGYKARYWKVSANPETGENFFKYFENGSHCYVEKLLPDFEYETRLNDIFCNNSKLLLTMKNNGKYAR